MKLRRTIALLGMSALLGCGQSGTGGETGTGGTTATGGATRTGGVTGRARGRGGRAVSATIMTFHRACPANRNEAALPAIRAIIGRCGTAGPATGKPLEDAPVTGDKLDLPPR